MINLNSNIDVVFNIPNIRKWEVLKVLDQDDTTPPTIQVFVGFYGPNVSSGLNRYLSKFVLSTSNNDVCKCIVVNPAPLNYTDQLMIDVKTIAGSYAGVSAAFYSVDGKTARKKAVEDVLVTIGLLSIEFAGA